MGENSVAPVGACADYETMEDLGDGVMEYNAYETETCEEGTLLFT